MVRKKLKESAHQQSKPYPFRLRGLDNTRLEALSDGVFAISIGLLLISTTAPEKFSELMAFIRDFVPFSITIILLTVIWYQHYLFFVRYGLKDAKIVAVNTLLLILILYYVYPLKFLFKILFLLFSGLFTKNQETLNYLFTEVIHPQDGRELMIIYGIGASGIFFAIALLYYIAYKRKKSLELTEMECFDTRTSIIQNLLMGGIPFGSTLIAILNIGGYHTFSISGFFYMIYPIIMPYFGKVRDKARLRKIESLADEPQENP